MTQEILKFENGKFRLEEVSSPKLRLKLSRDAFWKSLPDDAFETKSLGAAVRFREMGDANAQRIFKKVLQERYELPLLPALPGLDPHQREGLQWALSRKRSYLAHVAGAGKTLQAILVAGFSKGPGQSLFITPPSLCFNWEKEIIKFAPWAGIFPTIAIVPRSVNQNEMDWSAEFIICPDSMLAKDWVYAHLLEIPFKTIAVDEASRFKESTSERSLAFYGGKTDGKSFKGLFRSARHVTLLDGSVVPNRPIELWAPSYALHPEAIDYRDRDDFGYRYCGAKPNDRGVWEYLWSSNEKELKEKLQKDFMHVVTEEQLSHPERRRSMVMMSDVRSDEHKEWERKNLSKVELSDTKCQGDLARFRRELGMKKMPKVASFVSEKLDKNESILLFAWHREVCYGLMELLLEYKPIVIVGGSKDREETYKAFQEKRCKILIVNILAGGRGLNLQAADRIIFAEWSWSDETNKQAEKRASRKGSEKSVIPCNYLVVSGSMDEIVLSSVFRKQQMVKKVIG